MLEYRPVVKYLKELSDRTHVSLEREHSGIFPHENIPTVARIVEASVTGCNADHESKQIELNMGTNSHSGEYLYPLRPNCEALPNCGWILNVINEDYRKVVEVC